MERFKDSPLFANLISSYMKDKDEGLFTTRTVGELLWGYEDVLLKAIHTLSPDVDPVFGLFYKVLRIHIMKTNEDFHPIFFFAA